MPKSPCPVCDRPHDEHVSCIAALKAHIVAVEMERDHYEALAESYRADVLRGLPFEGGG